MECGRQRKWCCGIASCGESLKNIGRAFIKPSLFIYCQLPEVLRRPVETTPESCSDCRRLDASYFRRLIRLSRL